jgi:hypothetical protein
VSEQMSIAKQALNRLNTARFIYGHNPSENVLAKAKQQVCKASSVRPNLAIGKIQDTAITTEHHNDAVNSGMTKLDDLLILRELNKLADKHTYDENYYDKL